MDENAEIQHKYYFALMLRNSANHLPTIVDNLLRVIYHIGEKNVFMSIYEGRSTDDGHTTAMVETIKTTMEAIGIEYYTYVETEDEDTTGGRMNTVLEPMREMYRNGGRLFNTVVMMGDDLWCTEELLELLYLSRGQGAGIVCSTDVYSEVARSTDYTDSREQSSPFPLATMSTVDSSVKDTSQTTFPTTSLPVDSKTIYPFAYNHVSPLSQSSIRAPSTHPTTSPSHPPTIPNPMNVRLNSSATADFLPN